MRLIPNNWEKFQHYKDRCPPWIKFHRDLLNDRAFMLLPTASKALAPLLWLLASESKSPQGDFDASTEELEFRLRMTPKEIESGLKALISKGFFVPADNVLADRKQPAIPEGETETEGETKKETEGEGDAQARPSKKCPASFEVTDELKAWAASDAPLVNLTVATAAFRDHTFKNAITDWPGAWRNWLRKDQMYAAQRATPRRPTSHNGLALKNYAEGISADGTLI